MTLRRLIVLCAVAASLLAQADREYEDLQRALAEAGSSSVDFLRALEAHLAKYPKTERRPEIERAIVKAALESKDERRTIEYGERVLARESQDLRLLERVARALLSNDDRASAERALKHARRFEEGLRAAEKTKAPPRIGAAQWRDELDRELGRAFVLQARATGNLGSVPEAIALAQKSFDTFPTAEAAREIARWLARSGKAEEAIRRYADAFTIPDPRTRDSDRAGDRARMGELYRQWKGSEAGLGDLVLEAYDRATALVNERQLRLRALDPNAQRINPMEFTLTGLGGDKLALASLKGKVVVLDFWATWCGPCRVQHPLYEQVKNRFRDRSDVVFVSVNTDEDRGSVPEFVRENQWTNRVYFEDGLSAALQISSIPTAILIDKQGRIHSRMNGFLPDRFVDMLTERITQALGE